MNLSAHKVARRAMVENQLRANQVDDPRVIAAFSAIPREAFAAGKAHSLAYADTSLPLGDGRFLCEPRVLARLLTAARVQIGDVGLDLCCAGGYTTALLAWLSAFAVGVENAGAFADAARRALEDLEVSNAFISESPPAEGCPAHAPYDVIVLAGGVREVPRAVLEQLSEGGRLVTVLLRDNASAGEGVATLYARHGSRFPSRALFDATLPPLDEFAAAPEFIF
ncbi:MAG: protein-L-isoaspartate O-methyltransferase [Alphaproteobacteria bacterium]|nr:protein-L-isoaspartate O-methyltransferase [Alphaproteobacteria bacterium]MDA8003996.1 protein-L-isoaspartate O-methyltransferase [Alphaproteobacteria bacterium]MDA8005389.1 protein-L-isoaspartate O-methyltransferase [Alphaproteobacteria bacterium]MDA8013470.1 protein-L-isoaspartate O-methyltransferase [Alphaproteobacteria bacterium]